MFNRVFMLLFAAVLTFAFSAPTRAQDPTVCPPNALLSYVRAAAVCQRTGINEICYGNGAVEAIQQEGDNLPFDMAGDLIDTGNTRSVAVNTNSLDEAAYGIATLRLQLTLLNPEARSVTLLAFGNAEIINEVPTAVEFPVIANGTLNIRAEPDPQGTILDQLLVRESAIAHGRDEDGAWVRVTIPGTLDLGWVSAAVGAPQGDVMMLPVIATDTPYRRPFEIMTIRTDDSAALCGDAAANGVLLQTPNPTDALPITINGESVEVAGTVFIEADAATTQYTVIEGGVEINGQFAPAGTRIDTDKLEAVPYARERLLALPGNNLPVRVQVPEPATAEEIAAIIEERNTPAITPTPRPTVVVNICQYSAFRDSDLYSGPGFNYATTNVVAAGDALNPVLQNTDASGEVWYQLENSSWIAAENIKAEGECEPIPITDFFSAPETNVLKMETCEAQNGPLRDGQAVTIEFRPPAADNYGEMRDALNTDPGRVTVESESLRVRATEPILIASDPERWARIYSARWEAKAGTYRIEARRLDYVLLCSVTVRGG